MALDSATLRLLEQLAEGDGKPRRIVECADHASVQILRPSGFGSATPKQVLGEV